MSVTEEKILLIDDSRVMRCLIKDELLNSMTGEVVEARDGQVARDILAAEGASFSLIMLDWMLPKVSGMQLFWQIQSQRDLQQIPLVLMAQKLSEIDGHIPKYFYRYCQFLQKPLESERFWRAIASAKEKANQPHCFRMLTDNRSRLHAIAKPAMVFEDGYQVYAHHGWIFREDYLAGVELIRHSLDESDRLHAEGQAAIEFSDGFCCYFNHGVMLPETYGKLHPHQWQSQWLLTEPNAEIRRVLIQGIGYGRICQELDYIELDNWREYTLLKIENSQENEPILLLKMTCASTKSIHVLRVPPDMTSARAAIRWVNWGIDPEEFAVET